VIDRKKVEDIIIEALKESQVFLVEVSVSRSNVIHVAIDHPAGVNFDDCAAVHRSIEDHLDREQEDFELQVSSPGLGQPLRVFRQYLKAVGEKMEIVLTDGDLVKGTLLEARPDSEGAPPALAVKLAGTKKKPAPEEPVVIELSRIKTARVEIDFKQV
jgi:ribosome maturation factor RimP